MILDRPNKYRYLLGSPAINPNPSGGGTAVSGTVTANQGTANATPWNENLAQVGGVAVSLGQAAMASSIPVVLASNQASIPVAATLSVETTKVIGTVNQGTSPWIVAGGGTAGTAATGVVTVQGIAGMTKLLVTPDSVALPANQSVNVNQWAGTSLGTPTNFGTTPTAVIAASVNASMFAGTTALTQTSSALDINIKSGSIANTAFIANAGTNLNTSALALDATVAKLTIAQGAALGSNTVALIGGSVTTNAPTFTTGNINQLSLTTAGGLRVDLKDTAANTNNLNVNLAASAATVTVSATNLSTNVAQINAVTPLMGNGVTGTGSLRVTIASDNTAFAVNATLSAETTKVIGTIRMVGNVGGVLDAIGQNVAAAANSLQVGGQFNTTPTTISSGNQSPLQLDSKGSLRMVLQDAAGNVRGANVTASNELLVNVNNATLAVTESGTWNVGSSTATGSAVPANAFYGGGLAKTALPTAASDGNLTGEMMDKFGRQVVVSGTVRDLRSSQRTTISNSTSETTIVTAGASGVFNDIALILVDNTSATGTRIDFRDATAGTIIFDMWAPSNDTRGFSVPGWSIPQTTAANNWTAQCGTGVTDIRITVFFEKNK